MGVFCCQVIWDTCLGAKTSGCLVCASLELELGYWEHMELGRILDETPFCFCKEGETGTSSFLLLCMMLRYGL